MHETANINYQENWLKAWEILFASRRALALLCSCLSLVNGNKNSFHSFPNFSFMLQSAALIGFTPTAPKLLKWNYNWLRPIKTRRAFSRYCDSTEKCFFFLLLNIFKKEEYFEGAVTRRTKNEVDIRGWLLETYRIMIFMYWSNLHRLLRNIIEHWSKLFRLTRI